MSRDKQNYSNTLRPIEENFLKTVLTGDLSINVNENFIYYSDAQWDRYFWKWSHISETTHAQGHRKRIMKHYDQKSILTWYINQIKSERWNVNKTLLWTRKIFKVSIPVCLWCDSGQRNYSFLLKFFTKVYTLCKISYKIFGVHCLNSALYRDIQLYLNMLLLWREILVIEF